jgi:hypothetical protein
MPCVVEFEWDPLKALANLRKHGVDFANSGLVLYDERAITIQDASSAEEDRFVTLGMDRLGRIPWSFTRGGTSAHESFVRERRRRASGADMRSEDEERV